MAEGVTITKPSVLSLEEQTFDVLTSMSGARWRYRPTDERLSLAISQRLGLSPLVSSMLASRGLTLETVENFLSPTIKTSLPDPFHLLAMEQAATRIQSAIMNQEKVAVFGDYDVDGATSSALLARFFRMLGRELRVYIPDRMSEGYGPNCNAFSLLKDEGHTLVITVDCGAVSFDPLSHAASIGLDVVVLDHHMGQPALPKAVAVVNPNRFDETTTHRQMAAVGVTFLVLVAVNKLLRESGFYSTIKEPNLLSLLDLVALGTVCDVMQLTGINRAYVTQGLKVMAQRGNLGLATLADVAGMNETPSVYHLGFILGPRINAGGRVGKSDLGVRLLTTESPHEALTIAKELDALNQERKAIEVLVQEEAMNQVEKQRLYQDPMIIVMQEGWHPGVIGIVAGRIKERYGLPVAVIAKDGNVGKASVRSVPGVDCGAAITAAVSEGILLAGGGHAAAAGFSIASDQVEIFRAFCKAYLRESVDQYLASYEHRFDAITTVQGITLALLKDLQKLGPYGMGNPEPRLLLPYIRLVALDVVGAKHLRAILRDGRVSGAGGTIKAMAFNSVETPLGLALQDIRKKGLCHMMVKARISSWNGTEQAEVTIEDVFSD